MSGQLSRRALLRYTAAAAAVGTIWPNRAEASGASGAGNASGAAQASGQSLEQAVTGNIFVAPQAPRFVVAASDDVLTWRVSDYWGAEVAAGATPGTGQLVLAPAVSRNGFYTLELSLAGQPAATATTTFAIVPPFALDRIGASAFGVNTHFGQQWPADLIDLVAKAGIKNVRDEIRWQDVESVKGTYDFPDFITSYMGSLQSDHIDPLIIFDYTNSNYDGGATPYTDEGRAGFADYGAAVLGEFNAQIAWAEVSNEFNLPVSGDKGNGPANADPTYYFSLLKATYEAAKAQAPDVTVVGPVTDGIPLDWIGQLFELGGLDYMDVVSVHLYFLPDVPEVAAPILAQLNELIRKYNNGMPKPVWITEQGFPTYSGPTGFSELTQAMHCVRGPVVAFSQGTEKYFWYDFMNDGTADTQADNEGFVRNTSDNDGSWTPKPSYVAYATMTRQLTGTTYAGSDQVAGVNSHRFTGASDVRVIWAQQPATVAVSTEQAVTVTDLMGEHEQYWPGPGGTVCLSASPDPIYVTGGELRVSATDRYELVPHHPGVAFLNQPLQLDLKIDNTVTPRALLDGTFTVGGTSVAVTAQPGERKQTTVTLPAFQTPGRRKLVGHLLVRDQPVARLGTWVDVVHPVTVQPNHVIKGGLDVLTVVISNINITAQSVGQLSWQIGAMTGTAALDASIAGGGRLSFDIALAGLSSPGTYPLQVTLTVPSYPDVVVAGTVVIVDTASIQAIGEKTIDVDGQLDDMTGVSGLDLPTVGVLHHADGYIGYGGPSDLSANAWITWDQRYLYLSAQVSDDVHYQSNIGAQLWQGDSIQLAVSPGLPGESPDSFDVFTLALTATGPAVYHTHDTARGPSLGTLAGDLVAITRDASSATTTYEAAIPWGAIGSFDPDNRLLSLSLVVNDNDGNGRVNWITWGGGMTNGNSPAIQPAQYHPTILVSSQEE